MDSAPRLPPPPWGLRAAPQSSAADDFKTRALSAAASLEAAEAVMQPISAFPLLLSTSPAAAALHLKADDGETSAAVIDVQRWRRRRRCTRLTSCGEGGGEDG